MHKGKLAVFGGGASVLGLVALLLSLLVAGAAGGADNGKFRWDVLTRSRITSGPDAGKALISAGGIASADAADGSVITISGTGTFRSNSGNPQDVTGGGSWMITAPGGTTSGTFTVTWFVSFDEAPGALPSSAFVDGITGELENAHAGLIVLKVAYSDGDDGILVISCDLPGSPASLFEGITASKGFTDFWKREAPTGSPDTANANRTGIRLIH